LAIAASAAASGNPTFKDIVETARVSGATYTKNDLLKPYHPEYWGIKAGGEALVHTRGRI
jgi:hypothetical protein